MNICLFNLNRLSFEGGAEKYFVDLAKALSEQGHQVSIICNSYFYLNIRTKIEDIIYWFAGMGMPNKNYEKVYKSRDVGSAKIINIPLSFHLPFSEASREIKKALSMADVIYCKNEFIETTYLRWLIGNKAFKKVVVGVHTAIFLEKADSFHGRLHNLFYFNRIYRKGLRLCAKIHVPNADYINKIEKKYSIPKSKIAHIPYGLTDDEFCKKSQFNVDRKGFTVLFAGRFTEQKGIDYFEKLINRLSKEPEFNKINFMIAGSGERGKDVKDLARKFSNIDFVGFVKQMKGIYNQVDLVIVLSRWEMFPYNCLEPQAMAVPVVAFNIPGVRDIVIDKVTGNLIHLGDTNSFSLAVLGLMHLKRDDPSTFLEMKKRARQNILEKYHINKISKKMIILFNQTQ